MIIFRGFILFIIKDSDKFEYKKKKFKWCLYFLFKNKENFNRNLNENKLIFMELMIMFGCVLLERLGGSLLKGFIKKFFFFWLINYS